MGRAFFISPLLTHMGFVYINIIMKGEKQMNYTGQSYASNAKGNLGVTLGAVGTGLALMSGNNGCNNGGILGNIFGNNGECYETKEAANLRTALAIAQSEKYTSETARADMEQLFQELRTQDAKIADGLIQTGNAVGILNADVKCLQQEVARNREEAKNYTDVKVGAEADLRKCEDEKILVYTNGQLEQKVSYSKRIDSSLLCGSDTCCNGY